jgi:hypothetical protein
VQGYPWRAGIEGAIAMLGELAREMQAEQG